MDVVKGCGMQRVRPLPPSLPLQHRRFVCTCIAFTPWHSDIFHNTNMRSYMNLVVIVLAASTVSPALSSPIQYGNLLFIKGWTFLIRKNLPQ